MMISNLADNVEYDIRTLVDEFIEEFGNGALSLDLTVLMHQLMWSWIYAELKKGNIVEKRHFWGLMFPYNCDIPYDTIGSHCFLCLYKKLNDSVGCSICPAQWTSEPDGVCCASNSPYYIWSRSSRDKKFIDTLSDAAYKIATIEMINKEGDIL